MSITQDDLDRIEAWLRSRGVGPSARSVGGGGTAFTGVRAGEYPLGNGSSIRVNGRGQVLSVGASQAEAIPGTEGRFYQDNPPSLGGGTYAESFPVPPWLGVQLFKLAYLSVRWDFPFAAGERARIRLYRYRKTAEFGVFTYTQITDTFDADNTRDWSWTYDISDRIRSGFDLNPLTDSLAVSNVYTPGATPSVRALRVDFAMSKNP